ncbi:MAG: winged helix-turn-helix transcriptional regulator [Actinomycetota bacterium]|nr:winged helix-turn-helix transcriptional regulator [Actinomycetota bacterium]
MFGPRRYAQIRAGLHGISPNVLSQRLRDLDESGLVDRVEHESFGVTVYDLTNRGRALEPVLIELGRWGSREQVTSPNDLSVSAMMFACKTAFDPSRAVDGRYGIRVGSDTATVAIAGERIDVRRGLDACTDVVLDTDMSTLRDISFGRESITSAERAGRLRVTGDRRLASAFTRMFPIPIPR